MKIKIGQEHVAKFVDSNHRVAVGLPNVVVGSHRKLRRIERNESLGPTRPVVRGDGKLAGVELESSP